LHRVVQQPSGDGDGVHLHFGQNQSHFQGMHQVRLSGGASLAGVMLLGKFVGFANEFQIVVGTIFPHAPHQFTVLGYMKRSGRDLFAQSRHNRLYPPARSRREGSRLPQERGNRPSNSIWYICLVATLANSSRILVSGVSGPIGAALLPSLASRGFNVTRLVRGATSGGGQISWDPAHPLPPESVSGFAAVIHLAGESIVGRWTEAKKQRILDSRRLGTRHLAEALAKGSRPPEVLISGSAIGYYGNRGEDILGEDSP